MYKLKKLGQELMDKVLLPEHRDEFTKVHLAQLLSKNEKKSVTLMKKFCKKFYKDLFDGQDKVKEADFTTDVMAGLHTWATTWVSREFERRLEQYRIGLEVCVHNTNILATEVLADLKVRCGDKFRAVLASCKEEGNV